MSDKIDPANIGGIQLEGESASGNLPAGWEKVVINSNQSYQTGLHRFEKWCAECELSLQTVSAGQLDAYADWLRSSYAKHTVKHYLNAARWFVRFRNSLAGGPFSSGYALRVWLLGITDWRETDDTFRAALVMLSPAATGSTNLEEVSRFCGVPPREVNGYASRLFANGIWRDDGTMCGEWGDPDKGWLAIVLDAMVATGRLVRPSGEAARLAHPAAIDGEQEAPSPI